MIEKNKKKQENKKHRGSWFGVKPCTKIVENKKKKIDKEKCKQYKFYFE